MTDSKPNGAQQQTTGAAGKRWKVGERERAGRMERKQLLKVNQFSSTGRVCCSFAQTATTHH